MVSENYFPVPFIYKSNVSNVFISKSNVLIRIKKKRHTENRQHIEGELIIRLGYQSRRITVRS